MEAKAEEPKITPVETAKVTETVAEKADKTKETKVKEPKESKEAKIPAKETETKTESDKPTMTPEEAAIAFARKKASQAAALNSDKAPKSSGNKSSKFGDKKEMTALRVRENRRILPRMVTGITVPDREKDRIEIMKALEEAETQKDLRVKELISLLTKMVTLLMTGDRQVPDARQVMLMQEVEVRAGEHNPEIRLLQVAKSAL